MLLEKKIQGTKKRKKTERTERDAGEEETSKKNGYCLGIATLIKY